LQVVLVVGARPQIVKSAPIIHEASKDAEIEFQIVHTGQHYDFEMSRVFFDELELPDPVINLGVGSGSHALQTGEIMIGLERTIKELKPNVVLVPGDTNSTLAGALAAAKLQVSVSHVEAGARSYDMRMPEEVNRRLTDHCSNLLFAPTANCRDNLLKEGIPTKHIHLSGDTMYDALLRHLPKAAESSILNRLSLAEDDYAVLTMHRPRNVDDEEALRAIVRAMIRLSEFVIVFPVHPRTMQRLRKTGSLKQLERAEHVKIVDPVGYHDMLSLVENARVVFTDSGGMQKEAFLLHTPCVTLRERTEWVETVDMGGNVLVGNTTDVIVDKAREFLASEGLEARLKKAKNPFGNGKASKNIIDVLKEQPSG
jgi:UDP-N-acetylglucosamine 2-epimerase